MCEMAGPCKKPEIKKENSALMRKAELSRPVKSPADRILFLQRTIGNHAVQRLIKSGALQAKLTVNPPGDIYEQEADRVAKHVMRQINQPVSHSAVQGKLQRQETPEEEEKEVMTKLETDTVQRQEMPEEKEEELQTMPIVQLQHGGMVVAPDLEAPIQHSRGGGQPLSDNIRAPMEQAFGADFGGVRVHSDAEADMLNSSLHARAFTTGQDIFFKGGEYNPVSSAGQELIAHELAHVVQQKSFTPNQNLSHQIYIQRLQSCYNSRNCRGRIISRHRIHCEHNCGGHSCRIPGRGCVNL